MSKKAALGAGSGCFALLVIGALIGAAVMGIGDVDRRLLIGSAVIILVSWCINQWIERRWAAKKAEADQKEREDRQRERERVAKFYEENPERYVWEYCHMCNMKIPAFAQICPYCRTNLRENR